MSQIKWVSKLVCFVLFGFSNFSNVFLVVLLAILCWHMHRYRTCVLSTHQTPCVRRWLVRIASKVGKAETARSKIEFVRIMVMIFFKNKLNNRYLADKPGQCNAQASCDTNVAACIGTSWFSSVVRSMFTICLCRFAKWIVSALWQWCMCEILHSRWKTKNKKQNTIMSSLLLIEKNKVLLLRRWLEPMFVRSTKPNLLVMISSRNVSILVSWFVNLYLVVL